MIKKVEIKSTMYCIVSSSLTIIKSLLDSIRKRKKIINVRRAFCLLVAQTPLTIHVDVVAS